MRYYMIVILLACCSITASSQRVVSLDSVEVEARLSADSILFRVTSRQMETQLTLLMQGLTIRLDQPDSLTLAFPSASMVRRKVRRHPNEVKASFAGGDSASQIVRPDVMPLVAALNDTTATICQHQEKEYTRQFCIVVNRERMEMVFTIGVEKKRVGVRDGKMGLTLISEPSVHETRPEFFGSRLSSEHAPQPNGLGEGLRKEQVKDRSVRKYFQVNIKQ